MTSRKNGEYFIVKIVMHDRYLLKVYFAGFTFTSEKAEIKQ